MYKKIFFILIVLAVTGAVVGWFGLRQDNSWQEAAQAAGGYPYQIGLMNVVVTQCTVANGLCVGGPLCFARDARRCALYSDVIGAPSGGMGSNALFLSASLAAAGVMPGGQLIAGGMGPTLMDNGVLAGQAGCVGCVAQAEKEQSWFDKYIIAIFQDDEKEGEDWIDWEELELGE